MSGSALRSVAVLAALLALAPTRALAQSSIWEPVTTTNGPAQYTRGAMTFDAARGNVVFFGGYLAAYRSSTWLWNGQSWQLASPSVSPTQRTEHVMVYDSRRQRAVMFGGRYATCSLCNTIRLNDTWEWDGTNWAQRATTGPTSRLNDPMAYDSARGVTVLLTSVSNVPATWEWDGNTWTQRAPPQSPVFSTSMQASMVFDEARGRSLLFGMFGTAKQTWEYDGSTWINRTPATQPTPYWSSAMVYDSFRRRVVLYGGGSPNGLTNETWEWDGNAWSKLAPTGDPGPRDEHSAAYDPVRHRTVMVGDTTTMDTWLFHRRGQACGTLADCENAGCVDGVCCEVAQCGECQRCGAPNGLCLAVVSSSDPDTCSGVRSCDATGVCKGSLGQACTQSTECLSGSCSDGVCCNSACGGPCDVCSAALGATADGQCSVLPADAVSSCAPYRCSGSSAACGAQCTTANDCAVGGYCRGDNTCQAIAAPGTACSLPSECLSGYCVDGVCCDAPCGTACVACTAAKKGSGADGQCGPVADDTDPDSECSADAPADCGKDGACDGAGACRVVPIGTECGPTDCVDGSVTAHTCQGPGNCQASEVESCAPRACAAGSCLSACSNDAECAADAWCDAGACVALLSLGSACTVDQACASGHCADGVCCGGACTGQCEACNVEGALGVCVPVSGAPIAPRPACDSDPSATCMARICDGFDPTQCAAYVGADVVCREHSCQAGVESLEGTCRGDGTCSAPIERSCAPYVCDAVACKTSCSADSDCAELSHCDVSTGRCIVTVAACTDDRWLETPEGRIDCWPYRCDPAGACRSRCTNTEHCLSPYVCDVAAAECIGPEPPPPEESGCGCRVAPPAERRPEALFAFAALLACLRRARRSRAA